MYIWIIQTGEPMFMDGSHVRSMRAMNLATKAIEIGHKITIITANFDHFTKKKRFQGDYFLEISENLEIHFVDSPGYARNIGLKRFYDHFILGHRMKKIAHTLSKPDVAFIGYPPIETSWFMSKFCSKNKIPFILDVKDAWPTNIVEVFPGKIQFLAKLILLPYFKMFSFASKKANKISSISDSFLKWTQVTTNRPENNKDFVSYLTSTEVQVTEKQNQEANIWFTNKVELKTGLPTIYFVGSLSRSFNFDPIIESAKLKDFNLIIAGDGEQYSYLKNKTLNLDNVHMVGWVNTAQSKVIAENSDMALAPIKPLPDFEMSIPNKFFDYMRQGKPIISSLRGESKLLIERKQIGFYYSTSADFSEIVKTKIQDKLLVKAMSQNCLNSFKSEFEYNLVYGKLVDELEDLVADAV